MTKTVSFEPRLGNLTTVVAEEREQHDGMREPFVTTSGAARRVGKSESYIRKLSDSGRLPSQRTASGVRLFEPADLDRLARELGVVVDGRRQ